MRSRAVLVASLSERLGPCRRFVVNLKRLHCMQPPSRADIKQLHRRWAVQASGLCRDLLTAFNEPPVFYDSFASDELRDRLSAFVDDQMVIGELLASGGIDVLAGGPRNNPAGAELRVECIVRERYLLSVGLRRHHIAVFQMRDAVGVLARDRLHRD